MRRRALVLAALALAAAAAWIGTRERGQTSWIAAPAAEAGAARAEAALATAKPAGAARERVAEPAPAQQAAPSQAFVVEIQNARGAPIAAPWALFRGDEVLARGTAAVDGLARFDRLRPGAQLAVAPKNHPVQIFDLEPVERQVVALEAGAAVAGVVRVDGLEPSEPVELNLWCYDVSALDHVSQPVWDALDDGTETHGSQWLYAASGPSGEFRFEGLPADFSGDVYWAGPFVDARVQDEQEDSIELPGPVEGLTIQLEALPTVVGRVVDPGTSGPLEDVHVLASWFLGGQVEEDSEYTEDDGTFAFELGRGEPSGLVLEVEPGSASGSRVYPIDLRPGEKKRDVGDLSAPPMRVVAFAVRDEQGRPLLGVEVAPTPRDSSVMTDAEGRGELRLDVAVRALRAAAAGFATQEVPLPPPGKPLEIVLRPGTVLELHAATALAGAGVRVRSSVPPFLREGEPSWYPEPCGWRGVSDARDGGGFIAFFGAVQGTYLLNNVRPGIPLSVELIDASGQRVAGQDVPALRAGEKRVIELAGDARGRTLAGRVLTPEGRPAQNERVEVGPEAGTAYWDGRTDTQGCFRVEGLVADRVRIVVAGYPPLVCDSQPVVENPPVELVLNAGRTLWIFVRGPSGELVPEAAADIRLPGSSWREGVRVDEPTPLGLGGAPLAAVAVTVSAGAVLFDRTVAAGTGPAELEVQIPAWQSCSVRWATTRELLAGEELFIKLSPADRWPLWHRSTPRGTSGVETFPVIFPGRYELSAVVRRYNDEVLACEPRWVDIPIDAPASVSVELKPR